MLYIITILILLVLIFHYDVNGKSHNKMVVYYILMCWYIVVSAFQYCMGSDIPAYMNEFDSTKWKDLSRVTLFGFNNRQFGWILLVNLCKIVSDDFVFLKIIQAIFVNVVFFNFFKKHSKAIFTSILFYSLFLYLDLNLNLMRQSIAVALFLVGYRYYNEKRWLKYYLFAFLSIMFHNSAIILLFLPLVQLIKINRQSLLFITVIFSLFFIITNFVQLNNVILKQIFVFNDSDISFLGNDYLTSTKYGYNTSGNMFSFIIRFVLLLWIIKFNYNYNQYKSNNDILLFFVYLFILIINYSVPIFGRFNFYYYPFFIILLSNFIINYPKLRLANFRVSFIVLFVAFYSSVPIRGLFKINTSFNDKQIVQFYPYYTVFDKKTSPLRTMLWETYDKK